MIALANRWIILWYFCAIFNWILENALATYWTTNCKESTLADFVIVITVSSHRKCINAVFTIAILSRGTALGALLGVAFSISIVDASKSHVITMRIKVTVPIFETDITWKSGLRRNFVRLLASCSSRHICIYCFTIDFASKRLIMLWANLQIYSEISFIHTDKIGACSIALLFDCTTSNYWAGISKSCEEKNTNQNELFHF